MVITTNTNYMKKNLLFAAVALALGCSTVSAQNGRSVSAKLPLQPQSISTTPPTQLLNILNRGCGTGVPSQQWEDEFQKQVKAYVAQQNENAINGKTNAAIYTIPVIFHVIHGGQALGTYPNLAVGQVTSQVTVLNEDYAGIGLNVGNYPATAFQSYASSTVANLPAANKDGSGRVKIADCQVQFCLATKDPTGAVLATPGIERINYTSKGWTNPASFSTTSAFQTYFDGTIKPASIWAPTRYLNIWVSDCSSSIGLLGYATFPSSTTLTVMPGPFGTASTDGVWIYAGATGSSSKFPTGTYSAPFDKGRSATHEIGHWLGLRHIGGDVSGGCGSDGCLDTPPNKACSGTCGNGFGQNYGAPTYPFHANQCAGPPANVNGDMFMNFMDYTDDAIMYMFTKDQSDRMATAMSQCPFRNQLTTSASTLCTLSAAAPVASISIAATGCQTTGISTNNLSTGVPAPTYSWSANPSAGVTFNPNSTAFSPTITFATNGNYTVTCVATNSLGSNSNSKPITISTCTVPAASCNDTLTNLKNTDTLTLYTGGGYVGGNNSYGDKEKAEYYSSAGLVGNSRVMGGIVLFYRHASANIGTKGTSSIVFKMYNGNNVTGPSGAAINSFTNTIANILTAATATNGVTYCGNPTLIYSTNIMRPYSFNFASPTNITGDFLIGCTTSTLTGDTIAIFSSTGNTAAASTAWELQTPSTWVPFNDGTTASWQLNSSLAILPKIACITDVYNVNGISGNIAVFPNPSNGMFNFAVTMPQASDLNFTVTNSIGQVVYTKVEKGVTSAVLPLNLSHLSKGIYFVNIIDSTGDKVTKKIIIE